MNLYFSMRILRMSSRLRLKIRQRFSRVAFISAKTSTRLRVRSRKSINSKTIFPLLQGQIITLKPGSTLSMNRHWAGPSHPVLRILNFSIWPMTRILRLLKSHNSPVISGTPAPISSTGFISRMTGM